MNNTKIEPLSPLPWKINRDEHADTLFIEDDNASRILYRADSLKDNPTDTARKTMDATYAVYCANNHARLIAENKELRKALRNTQTALKERSRFQSETAYTGGK